MKAARIFLFACIAYGIIVIPFTANLKNRPLALKLGYSPEAEILRLAVLDHKLLMSEWMTLKVIHYFGSIFSSGDEKNIFKTPPEYYIMFKTLQAALKLDPYNMDAYYFAQAAFTWETGRYREVNNMLEYGMKYRNWDYILPFFAGFNNAYFLKDYKSAAHYMQRAADLSGEPLFANLAARYFHEAGQTDLGIIFIESMERSAKSDSLKRTYALRKRALLAAKEIQEALKAYRLRLGKMPTEIGQLVDSGFLSRIPEDPYGGRFFINAKGNVESTSKFAFGSHNK